MQKTRIIRKAKSIWNGTAGIAMGTVGVSAAFLGGFDLTTKAYDAIVANKEQVPALIAAEVAIMNQIDDILICGGVALGIYGAMRFLRRSK